MYCPARSCFSPYCNFLVSPVSSTAGTRHRPNLPAFAVYGMRLWFAIPLRSVQGERETLLQPAARPAQVPRANQRAYNHFPTALPTPFRAASNRRRALYYTFAARNMGVMAGVSVRPYSATGMVPLSKKMTAARTKSAFASLCHGTGGSDMAIGPISAAELH